MARMVFRFGAWYSTPCIEMPRGSSYRLPSKLLIALDNRFLIIPFNMKLPTSVIISLVASFCFTTCSLPLSMSEDTANPWTRFRGDNGKGTLEKCDIKIPWEPKQVLAKLALPGAGNGSPVIWGTKAFLLCGDSSSADRFLVCADIEKPQVLWKQQFASQTHKLHKFSSYASSTPCVDDKNVYCAWGAPTTLLVKAFTHDGKEIWSRDLGRYETQHGFGSSPILAGDNLILFNSQDAQELPPGVEPGVDTMIAFNKNTGETVWQTQLHATRVCYGAPCLAEIKGEQVILCSSTGDGFFAINAKTGEQVWNGKESPFAKRVVSSLVYTGSLLISTEGSGGGGHVLFAVKADGSQEEVYRITRGAPYVPTPVVKGDLMFLWADNGIASCVDVATGNVHWSERIGGNVSSSPVIIGNSLVGISQDGVVTVLAAEKDFKNLGEVRLEQTVRSTPAATKDRLLIRSDEQLWVIAP
jgi:outer membrane protein assembly factor BamB